MAKQQLHRAIYRLSRAQRIVLCRGCCGCASVERRQHAAGVSQRHQVISSDGFAAAHVCRRCRRAAKSARNSASQRASGWEAALSGAASSAGMYAVCRALKARGSTLEATTKGSRAASSLRSAGVTVVRPLACVHACQCTTAAHGLRCADRKSRPRRRPERLAAAALCG